MKHRYSAALVLMMSARTLCAAEPTILIEDTGLEDPAAVTWPPRDLQPGTAADGGELLRNIPGVSGARMGGHGIEPIIRGQSQNRLNILLDGAYLYGGCPNRMDPPTAYSSMDAYDSVTVIKGSHTVIYGGGGSGGTVLFERETPRFAADKPYRANINAGYTSNSNTRNAGADVAAGGAQGYLRGVFGYTDADSYEDGDGNETRTAYTTRDTTLLFGYTPTGDTTLELSYEATREDDVLFAGAGMDSPYSDNDMVRLKLDRKEAIGPLSGLRAEIYYSDIDHLMDNYSLRPLTAPMKMATPADSETVGGRMLGTLEMVGGTKWTFGIDHQKNNRNADRRAGPAAGGDPKNVQSVLWPDVDVKQTGLFAEMKTSLNAGDTLKAGLRYDRVESTARRTDALARVSPILQRSPNQLYQLYYGERAMDHHEDNIGGFVSYRHTLSPDTAFFGTLSRSVRTADATERFLGSDNAMAPNKRWVGNPGLAPEKHHQVELGITAGAGGWDLSASGYYNAVSDYILRDRAHGQPGILQSDNASIYRNVDAAFYGLDIDAGIRWSTHWSSRVTLSYVHATNTTDDRPIAQTPPLEGTLSLEYTTDRWNIGAQAVAQAKQTRVEADPAQNSGLDAAQTPGWGILNLYGGYDITDNVTLKAGVDNLLDRTYAYHVNRANSDPFNPAPVQVNEPGRALWLRLNATF